MAGVLQIFCCILVLALGLVDGQEKTPNATKPPKKIIPRTEAPVIPTVAPEPPQTGFQTKDEFLDSLIGLESDGPPTEYQSFNGWYNNPSHPEYGSVDSQLLRLFPPFYSDGAYEPWMNKRPNPFVISDQVFAGKSGSLSETGKTAFVAIYAQHVFDEIVGAERPSCPPEKIFYQLPKGHFYRSQTKHTIVPVRRHRYDTTSGSSPNNPRQQLNEITAWIDGSSIYGTSKGWSDSLRSFKDGKLKSHDKSASLPALNNGLPLNNPVRPDDGKLKPSSRLYRLGNANSNENPALLSLGILWFRLHNEIAEVMRNRHPTYSDERLFQKTRKLVVAIYQQITMYEWLPAFLGESVLPYTQQNYVPCIDPAITQEFLTAAKYYIHTLLTPQLPLRNSGCEMFRSNALQVCDHFWKSEETITKAEDPDSILLGLTTQPAEKDDNIIVDDYRVFYHGPPEFTRRDRVALNIATGRDHGLTDYKTARLWMGLKSFETFGEMAEICSNISRVAPQLFSDVLPKLYNGNTGLVDFWVGGMLETEAGRPGELFRIIIKEQFERIRNGDRFWFEYKRNGQFSETQIRAIKSIRMSHLLRFLTMDETNVEVQDNVFRLPSQTNPGFSYQCKLKLGLSNYDCVNADGTRDSCSFLNLTGNKLNKCSPPTSFDFFEGSEAALILTFISPIVFIFVCIGILYYMVETRRREFSRVRRTSVRKKKETLDPDSIIVTEWMGKKEGTRQVILKYEKKSIVLRQLHGPKVRSIDLSRADSIEFQVGTGFDYLLIRVPRECDLILKFDEAEERDTVISQLEAYLGSIGVGRKRKEINSKNLLKNSVTKADRQMELERFFRVVFAQAFNINQEKFEVVHLDADQARDIIYTELTIHEFAEAFSLRSDAVFVQQMFALVDSGNKGYITFREFLDIIVIFANGCAEKKMKLMFDMYDINRLGTLTRCDFASMIKSLLELANHTLSEEQVKTIVTSMFKHANLDNKETITFEDFKHLMSDYKEELGYAQLTLESGGPGIQTSQITAPTKRHSAVTRAEDTVLKAYNSRNGQPDTPPEGEGHIKLEALSKEYSPRSVFWTTVVRYAETYYLHIFWITLYTLFMFGLCIERYFFALGREHNGLRKISGHWVSVARSSASGLMFAYSTILLTMCRNTITILRETVLHKYIPFDSAVWFHKYIAIWGLIFSVIHTVGHALNFYQISTQSADDLNCLFRDFFHSSHELPKITYWAFQTITGLTGVILVAIVTIMYVFAHNYARRNVFQAFWITHNLYPIFYILMILHGLGRVVQDPIFYYFFLGPLLIFVIDQLISISRKKVEIAIIKAVPHPSEVLQLEFKRPANFQYKSGQWVRIACPILRTNEFHPFTLSSAPHEENLSLHIRAVGPWTSALRKVLSPDAIQDHPYPKIYLDGPFGEGHQDWFQYEVSVMVGGGIGVTPFASILKDIAHKSALNTKIPCKKVYFLWVTRTQKHFEWLTDIIKSVEERDKQRLVSVHIFITQFYQKFDLRTTMVYICERHFQRVSNQSLFTGLKSITHFGRPDIKLFLSSLEEEYPDVRKVGVFSCGPSPMTLGVQQACDELNKQEGMIFVHHFENF